LVPKLDHLLLLGARLGSAQIGLQQGLNVLLAIVGYGSMQPKKAGTLEGIIADGGEFSGLIPASVINRLIQRL
jgi:hypothetical protein